MVTIRIFRSFAIVLSTLLFLSAIPLSAEVVVQDKNGRDVVVKDASRIISAGGDITEIVYALGAGDRLIATDTTSLYPKEALETPKVGYLRALSAEGVLSLNPTLLLTAGDAGPPAALEQLRNAGLPVLLFENAYELSGVLTKISTVSRALGLETEGEALATDVADRMAAIEQHVANIETRPQVLFLLNIAQGAPMAAGQETSANAIIELAGGENVLAGYSGYKPLSPEAAIAAMPDYIVMMEHTVRQLGGLEEVIGLPALKVTPAVRKGNIVVMDGNLLLGFGPRLPEAVGTLAQAFHPEAGF